MSKFNFNKLVKYDDISFEESPNGLNNVSKSTEKLFRYDLGNIKIGDILYKDNMGYNFYGSGEALGECIEVEGKTPLIISYKMIFGKILEKHQRVEGLKMHGIFMDKVANNSKILSDFDGYTNTEILTRVNSPMASQCKSFGDEYYIPSCGELIKARDYINSHEDIFMKEFKKYGIDPTQKSIYWLTSSKFNSLSVICLSYMKLKMGWIFGDVDTEIDIMDGFTIPFIKIN